MRRNSQHGMADLAIAAALIKREHEKKAAEAAAERARNGRPDTLGGWSLIKPMPAPTRKAYRRRSG